LLVSERCWTIKGEDTLVAATSGVTYRAGAGRRGDVAVAGAGVSTKVVLEDQDQLTL